MFQFYADKNRLSIQQKEPLTSGSVNVYPARFDFSPEWEGLTRMAVFRAGGTACSVLLDDAGECVVPWEVMRQSGVHLWAGVYGVRDGSTILPTVWADCGYVMEGTKPGDGLRPPTPDIYQQLLSRGDMSPGRSRNLLDNWYFADPVNQSGKTEYRANGGTVDRWTLCNGRGTVHVVDGGLQIVPESGIVLEQRICTADKYRKTFAGRTVTASLLFPDGLAAVTAALPSVPEGEETGGIKQSDRHGNTLIKLCVQDGLFRVQICAEGTADVRIIAAKLELGSRQTLAHQEADGGWALNDPPPDRDLELARCQRYQQALALGPGDLFSGYLTDDSKAMIFSLPLTVPLRTEPLAVLEGARVLIRLPDGYSPLTPAYENPYALTKLSVYSLRPDAGYIVLKAEGWGNALSAAGSRLAAIEFLSGYLFLDANL